MATDKANVKRLKTDNELKECEDLIQECGFLSARLLFSETLPNFGDSDDDEDKNDQDNRTSQFMLLCINRWFSKGEKFTAEIILVLLYLVGGAAKAGQGTSLSDVAREVIEEKADDPIFQDLLKRNSKPSPNY